MQPYLFSKLIPRWLCCIFGARIRNATFGGGPEFVSSMGIDVLHGFAAFIVKSIIFMSSWGELFVADRVYPVAVDQSDV